MSRRQLVMSKRSENAKRLNANEDNLLQMEMERFEKQHNKEMKNILLEKQIAKEAMSDIRRYKASSLLAARMALQENGALNNRSDNSPTLSKKVFCEAKQSPVPSRKVQGLKTNDERPLGWETRLPSPAQKTSSFDNEYLDLNCNATLLPSTDDHFGRPRTRAQTFSEGTAASQHDERPLVWDPRLPNPAQKTSSLDNEYLDLNCNATLLPSRNDHFGCFRTRAQTFSEGTTTSKHDGRTLVREPCIPNPAQKTSSHDNKYLDLNCNETLLPSENNHLGRPRTRAQTFSEGTTARKIIQSSETYEGTPLVGKPFLPDSAQKTSSIKPKTSGYLSVSLLPSKNDHYGQSRARARTFTEGTTKAQIDLEDGSLIERELDPLNFSNQHQEQQRNSAVKNIPILKESVVEDSRPRSRSDNSMLFKRLPTPTTRLEKSYLSANVNSISPRSKENSPEPHGSPSLRAQLPLSPQIKRRVSLDASRLLLKQSSLQLPCIPLTQPQKRELSPSRGIAKFRQTGSAASAAQTLVSRYQREKAISKATENLIAKRQKREKVRQEHQQMKEDWTKAGRTRTTGLKARFFTIAQLVMALNALKKAASGRSSFTEVE